MTMSTSRPGLGESFRRSLIGPGLSVMVLFVVGSGLLSALELRGVPAVDRAQTSQTMWLWFSGGVLLAIGVGLVFLVGGWYPHTTAEAWHARDRYMRRAAPFVVVAFSIAMVALGLIAGDARPFAMPTRIFVLQAFAGLAGGSVVWLVTEWLVRRRRGTWLPDQWSSEEAAQWVRAMPNARMMYAVVLIVAGGIVALAELVLLPATSVFGLVLPVAVAVVLWASVWLLNKPGFLVPRELRGERGVLTRLMHGSS
jgi:uncharacterized membrane-anchored protein YitT (DUF2179 family)